MGGTLTPANVRSETPTTAQVLGASSDPSALVVELEVLRGSSGPRAAQFAAVLERLAPLSPSPKLRARAVKATSGALGNFNIEGIETQDLASLLQALTPAYLADGTRPALLPFLRKALPVAARQSMSATAAAATMRALAVLPLDDTTKGSAAELITAWAPRLRKLIPSMGPEQLAGALQGLRLVRGSDRTLMLELLALLLRRGIEADGWTPQTAAQLCRGLLGIRADPGGVDLARDLLAASLPAIAARASELSIEQACDVLAFLASVPALPKDTTGAFVGVALPHLQSRIGQLRPFEVATIVRALGHLDLAIDHQALANAFAQRAVVSLQLEELAPLEAVRILLGLGGLSLEGNAGAVAASFALAVSDALGEAAEHLPVRELAELLALLGALNVDDKGRIRLQLLVQRLLPEVQRRAGKFSDAERASVLRTIHLLDVPLDGSVKDLVAAWREEQPTRNAEPAKERQLNMPARSDAPKGNDDLQEQHGLTGREVMAKLSISRTEIYRRLRILGMDPPGAAGFSEDMIEQLRVAHTLAPTTPAKTKVGKPKAQAPSSKTARVSLDAASKELGIHRTALDRWVREEKELAGKVTREGRRVWLDPQALPLLRTIQERRNAAAPESLRRAWAARRAGKRTSVKPPKTKDPVPAPKEPRQEGPQPHAAWNQPAPEKVSLRSHIEAQLEAISADERPRPPIVEPSGIDHTERMVVAMERMVASMERMAADFGSTVRALLEQQRVLIDRVRPVQLKVFVDEE